MDRRKRKSKQAIFSVLLSLLDQKGIADISVSEIVEEADLSRGTFYSQFLDKYDLLDNFIESHLINLFHVCSAEIEFSKDYFNDIIDLMVKFLLDHKEIYTVLFNHPDTYKFRKNFLANLNLSFNEQNSQVSQVVNKISDTDIQFLCYGILGVLHWFINHTDSISPNMISKELKELMAKIYLK